MSSQSHILNPNLTLILFAVLVKKCGGKVKVTQADIDEIAYNKLFEEGYEDGSLEFILEERKKSS